MGEVEALNFSRRTAVALLEREQALGRRQPQRARQAKKRALLFVIVHHSGNPLACLDRARNLGGSDSERLGIAGGSARNRGYLKRADSGRSPTLVTDQCQETVLHGGDTKRTQRRGNLIGRKRWEGCFVKVELDGRIGANGCDLAAQQRIVDVRTQVFAHLALDLIGVCDDLVQLPYCAMSALAFLGPMPGTPGMLSDVSPFRP